VSWVTPPLINAPDQAAIVVRAAATAVGEEHVVTDMAPITGGEDFAYMMEATPGALVFLGNGTAPDGVVHNVHTPNYDFNDDAIPAGVDYWVSLVHQQLAATGG
jgi:metal-dependent amidase/aminoacylase/carboxypeptidase family protein